MAVLKSLNYIKASPPHLVIMLTGICDLTWKNRLTKQVGIRHRTITANSSQVLQAVRAAHDLLVAQGVRQISFATVTGADLSDCNHPPRGSMSQEQYIKYCNTSKIIHPDQTLLNESILHINKQIVIFNRSNSSNTVWVSGLVHSYYKKKYHHCYLRLADGIHPDPKTQISWVSQLVRSTARILSRWPAPPAPITTLRSSTGSSKLT